jgi:flagellar hook-basal body complex protein FliE
MSLGALDAASAYGRVLGTGSGLKPAAPAAAGGAEEAGFGAMVENLVGTAAQTLRTAETASAKQVAGKGDLIDVVTAIGAAETALDTLVAVRDKVVNAYTDIMRMQI